MTSRMMWMAGLATAVLLHSGVITAHPEDEDPSDEIFTVGKTGEVKIGHDVSAGSVLVKRGKYLFEHRVDGERHIIVLTGVGKDASERLYEIPMRLFASAKVAKRSALIARESKDHTVHITLVQVAGEGGDHIPEPQSAGTR